MKKKVLQNICPIFQSESPVFLWLHRRRLLTLDCCRVFTGYLRIFTGYLWVFDGLAKPGVPPTASVRCQNPFFPDQKPGFCPATNFFFEGYGSHRSYIHLYIYIYIYI